MEAVWSGLKDKWKVGKLRQLSLGDFREIYREEREVIGEGDFLVIVSLLW